MLLAAVAAKAGNTLTVLQYHHVATGTPPATSVTPAEFRAHMSYLKANAYQVLDLVAAIARLKSGAPLPERSVAITFDDAYASVFSTARRILSDLGFTATVFVNTQAIDDKSRGYMTWAQMRKLAAAGWSFGNHSRSHRHLIRRLSSEDDSQWRVRVRKDIVTAGRRLNKELGSSSQLFAYPYGEFDPELTDLIKELGLTGFGQHSGPIGELADFTHLPRFAFASRYANITDFADKVRALPMPVIRILPESPVLKPGETRPIATVTLGVGDFATRNIQCYVSGQGRVVPRLASSPSKTITIRARQPLAPGRSRYNCTVKHRTKNRYYWLSLPWILPKADGTWYTE